MSQEHKPTPAPQPAMTERGAVPATQTTQTTQTTSAGQSSQGMSGYLVQLLAAARTNSVEAMDRLLQEAQRGIAPVEQLGTEYLLFACADAPCAIPLTMLREVRPSLPQVVPLPFSPDWLIGIFPLRTELLALVDPAPLLLGYAANQDDTWFAPRHPRHSLYERRVTAPLVNPLFPTTALLVGTEERVLAWAVTAVGDIVAIQDEDIVPATDSSVRIPKQYVTGIYTLPQSNQHYTILDAEQVLADLFAGLEEKETHNG